MRNASCSRDISMLNTPTLALRGAECGVLGDVQAKVVLPIEGRPAMTIRSPFCSPAVISSSRVKPVLRPGDAALVLRQHVESIDDLADLVLQAGRSR